jgi:hypothetical protein
VDALHHGFTHYGPSAGLPDLRKAYYFLYPHGLGSRRG